MVLVDNVTAEEINAALRATASVLNQTVTSPNYTQRDSVVSQMEDLSLLLGSGVHSIFLNLLDQPATGQLIDVAILKVRQNNEDVSPLNAPFYSLQLDSSLAWQWSDTFQQRIVSGIVFEGEIYDYTDFANAWHGSYAYTTYNQTSLNLIVPLDLIISKYTVQGQSVIGVNSLDTDYYIRWRVTNTKTWSAPIRLTARASAPTSLAKDENTHLGSNAGHLTYAPDDGLYLGGNKVVIDGDHLYIDNIFAVRVPGGIAPPVLTANDTTKVVYVNGALYVQANPVAFNNPRTVQSNDVAVAFTQLRFSVETP